MNNVNLWLIDDNNQGSFRFLFLLAIILESFTCDCWLWDEQSKWMETSKSFTVRQSCWRMNEKIFFELYSKFKWSESNSMEQIIYMSFEQNYCNIFIRKRIRIGRKWIFERERHAISHTLLSKITVDEEPKTVQNGKHITEHSENYECFIGI